MTDRPTTGEVVVLPRTPISHEPNLPLPDDYGLWSHDHTARVDTYKSFHGITLKETCDRISNVTGNSPKGLSLRYYKGKS
jgi:hypothetical protein